MFIINANIGTFFTDRYMVRNDDYIRALQESDLSMRAGNMEGRLYFISHGTADTLVHQQHSLMMARALIDQGIGFRHQVNLIRIHELKKRFIRIRVFLDFKKNSHCSHNIIKFFWLFTIICNPV